MRNPWVLVAGGFHFRGGMDKANAALAQFLVREGFPVHLVGHIIDPSLARLPNLRTYQAARPGGSYVLGEWPLARLGMSVARAVCAQHPDARVVVNGGNCPWSDINWVHSVHHAWPCSDQGAPLWFRTKNRITKELARSRERRALKAARFVVANSNATRTHLLNLLAVPPEHINTIYLGVDPELRPPNPAERTAARAWLNKAPERPLVGFVGTLGYDNNKGFDTLLKSWRNLCANPSWDADLIVAGDGRGLSKWREAAAPLRDRVHFLGFSERVCELLAAIDLLVSPVRYEAYGLNVQEAICRGVPAMVSRSAGVAERYPRDLGEILLSDPNDVSALEAKLLSWRRNMEEWRRRFTPLADQLRENSWTDMARQIAAIGEVH